MCKSKQITLSAWRDRRKPRKTCLGSRWSVRISKSTSPDRYSGGYYSIALYCWPV